MLMQLTINQVKSIVEYKANTFVRSTGFLYIRYACDPEYLWAWFKKYLLDDEEIRPCIDNTQDMTIGEYCEKLLTD